MRVISKNLLGETEENHENWVRVANVWEWLWHNQGNILKFAWRDWGESWKLSQRSQCFNQGKLRIFHLEQPSWFIVLLCGWLKLYAIYKEQRPVYKIGQCWTWSLYSYFGGGGLVMFLFLNHTLVQFCWLSCMIIHLYYSIYWKLIR
jgi:hypothetical protein